jgi:hypothetical protein
MIRIILSKIASYSFHGVSSMYLEGFDESPESAYKSFPFNNS